MGFETKKYVDLTGLETFTNSLKNKLKANSVSDWVVNYASNAGKATSDGSGNDIVATYLTKENARTTYVPLTRTIAGEALSGDITADALRTAINVENGSEKNKIVAIKIDNVEQSIGSDRSVTLDLSKYAKKSDITAVLKFMGVVSEVSALPEANKDRVGHVYIVASGKDKDAYAEYVCVDTNGETTGGYAWEKLGNGASLDGYYTQEEINAKFNALSLGSTGADGSFISTISQTAGKVSATATAFATSVASGGTVAPTSGAVYIAIEGAKNALIGTGAGDSGSTIKKNEAAIATLNGADTVEGSVAKKIKDAIGGLTGTQSEGDYVTSVTQTDGIVSVTRASKGTVADGNIGLVDGGTVHSFVTTHVTTAIQGLDVTAVGGDGKFLSAISETDGKISATVQTLDTAIPDSNPSNIVAPTTSAFKDYSDSAYVAISSVSSEEISQLFFTPVYTVQFINDSYSPALLLQSSSIKYGELPVYKGSTPVYNPDAPDKDAWGEFLGWDKELSVVIEDTVYTAKFKSLISKTRDFITGTTEVAESDSVTSISDYAFYKYSTLTSVSFPVATSIGNYAFSSCSKLIKASFPVATSIGDRAFESCSSLTEVSIPKATSIGEYAFYQCKGLTEVSFPEVTSIGSNAFYYCSGLTEVSFPKATSIGDSAFSSCSKLTTIYIGTESDTVCTLSSTNAIPSSVTDIYVPYSLVDSYKPATNWSTFASKIKAAEQPAKCISLSITADNVAIGNATSTTVHYIAECTYTIDGILQEGTMVFTGEGTSDSFEQNTSTTDTVQRTVSFTFLGQTATTTITQGVWVNKGITVTTEGISDYGWVTADSKYNIVGYDVYMSNNKKVDNSQAVMKLECVGYEELTIYIRSYAESKYDYTIASNVNASTYPTDYRGVKAHTKGKSTPGTLLSDYTEVKYTGLKDHDFIYIVFTKDSSGESGDDRGYVLIPKLA